MKFLCGVVAGLLALTGCSSATPTASEPTRLTVTAAFYPSHFVAERVGGDAVTVTNLTTPGAEPHDLELTPKQVASLGEVDLVVYQKGFQPAVDAAVQTVPPKRVVDTASFLTLQPGSHDHDHADSEEHAEHADDEALDPHTWLDTTNLASVAERVRDELTAAQPASAAAFAQNTRELVADLGTLDGEFRQGLTGCQRTTFITSHDAFGYLAARYDLEQVGIRGLDPDTEPSAARIAEVQATARQHGVTTIFFETLVSPDVANSVAGDLGLATDVLDPLEGLTEQSRGRDYLEVMRANLAALQKANGCP